MDNLGRQLGVEIRRRQDSNLAHAEFVAKEFIVQGRFMVDGAGWVAKDLTFPVAFTEEPIFSSGLTLEVGETVVVDLYPEHSETVISWITEPHGPDTVLYRGCRMGVVTKGPPSQRSWVNWTFIGIGLVNPIGGTGTTDGVV